MSGERKKMRRDGNGITIRLGTIAQKKGEKLRQKDQIGEVET